MIPKRRPIPNKRSYEIEEAIVAAAKDGATLDHAALSHGIHPVTFLRWRRCELPDVGSDRDERCWRCRGCRLQQKVDCALAIYQNVLLQRIANATDREGNPIWQASAWILERRFREEYSLKTFVENKHSVDIGNQNAERLVATILARAQQ